MEDISKVYIRVDEAARVIAIEGGYTIGNIQNIDDWILVDEGDGDRYNLCQNHYLPGPLMDERGIYRYKYVDGEILERTDGEMDAEKRQNELRATVKTENDLSILTDEIGNKYRQEIRTDGIHLVLIESYKGELFE